MVVAGKCSHCGDRGSWEGCTFDNALDAMTRPYNWGAIYPMDTLPYRLTTIHRSWNTPELKRQYGIISMIACPNCHRRDILEDVRRAYYNHHNTGGNYETAISKAIEGHEPCPSSGVLSHAET